jgi:hypothetical protein
MLERPITLTLIQLAASINRAHIAATLFGISLLFVVKETIIAKLLKKIVTSTTHIAINGVRIIAISVDHVLISSLSNIASTVRINQIRFYSVA